MEQAPRDTHIVLGFQPSDYNKWKFTNSPTFLEVLEEFPSLRVSASFLLSQLPILKPRYYSISSSRDLTPTVEMLCVSHLYLEGWGQKGILISMIIDLPAVKRPL